VLIIGAGEVGHTVAAKVADHPEYRIDLIGCLDDGEPRHNGRQGPPLPVIVALDDLDAIVAEECVVRVIVAFSRARHNDFVRACAGWSLSWDIKLLLQTVPAVLNKRGVY
jgi:FlaA1/EpsC-like NDP-sugar epimerase